ncbi:MAG: ABC transporter permease [Myxococcota bacterium]
MFQLAHIASRNLLRNRRRTLLTLAALAVGVFAVVGVRGFLNGLQGSLLLSITEGGLGAIQVHRKGYMASVESTPLRPDMPLDEALLQKIRAVPGVTAVTPRINSAGMVNVGDETVFSMFNGVDPEQELKVSPRRKDAVVTGAWTKGGTEVLLGMEIANAVKARPGVPGAVLTNDVDGVMNASDLTVVGTLAAATQGEKKLVVMPLAMMQQLLRMEGRITEIAVQVTDLDEAGAVAERIQAVLGDEYEVHTWETFAAFAKDVRQTQNTALNYVTYIFLLIMLMGIANTLLMSVMERVREIGTMMAVGTKRRQILTMFLIEALILGALGASVGAVLGFGLVEILGHVGVRLTTPGASLPQLLIPTIKISYLLRMVMLSGVGAALAALYPAYKASRLRPVEALASV